MDRASFYSPSAKRLINAPSTSSAHFGIGEIVRHKIYDFRGVIFDIDPVFANNEEWYQSIPQEVRPKREQPYYHLLADNGETHYVAYVSQQNLKADHSGDPVDHPSVHEIFSGFQDGKYTLLSKLTQ